jgi:hypothetical protein
MLLLEDVDMELNADIEVSIAGGSALGSMYQGPEEVLGETGLSVSEKRAILASWSSDLRALENFPELRRLPSGAVVELEQIVQALKALDREVSRGTAAVAGPPYERRRGRVLRGGRGKPIRVRTDDEGPPPSFPAVALPVPRTSEQRAVLSS